MSDQEQYKASAVKKVLDLIESRRDDIVDFLSGYVQQPSTNPDLAERPLDEEARAMEWVRSKLDGFGFLDTVDVWEVEKNRPNLAAVWKGTGGGRSLMFNGHNDIVPVTEEQLRTWVGPGGPYGGVVSDGKVWGRGAADMKGGNTAFIMAAKLIRDAGVRLAGDLMMSLVTGEETGRHELGCDTVLDRGYRADFAVIPELTGLKIFPVLKGEIYFRVKVRGKATHICNRNMCVQPLPYGVKPYGVSAIDKMLKIQEALLELERQWAVYEQHPMIPPGGMFINVNTIKGGDSFSSIPDACEIRGSLLFNPGLTSEQVMSQIRGVIDSVARNDYWLRENPPEIEMPYLGLLKEPVDVPTTSDGVRALVSACRTVLGTQPEITFSPFVCDANFWFPAGQPVVVCGPGTLTMGAHSSNEFIPVQDVVDACKVFAALAIDWCGVARA